MGDARTTDSRKSTTDTDTTDTTSPAATADEGHFDRDLDRGHQGEEVHEPDLPFPPEGGVGTDRGIAVRGPGASVARARSFTTYDPPGMCCNFVWNCIAAPHRFGLADANAAWQRSTQRHDNRTPPAGAPVYWAGGKHGHIALSIGGGKVRSTDWPRKGQVGDVSIDRITTAWGITYRGWSTDFAGQPIPGLGGLQPVIPSPAPGPGPKLGSIDDEAIRPGKRGRDVKRFNAALWNSMPADYRASHQKAWMGEASDLYGPVSQQVCFDRYALLNRKDAKKWPMPQKPVWPGPGLLRWLGFAPDRALEAPGDDASGHQGA